MKKSLIRCSIILLFLVMAMGIYDIKGQNRSIPAPAYIEGNQKPVIYYHDIDEKPTFKGGDTNKFGNWMMYKRDNMTDVVPGYRTSLHFIVDITGKICHVVINSQSERDKKAYEKILKKSPRWKPGKHHGETVNTYIEFSNFYYGD